MLHILYLRHRSPIDGVIQLCVARFSLRMHWKPDVASHRYNHSWYNRFIYNRNTARVFVIRSWLKTLTSRRWMTFWRKLSRNYKISKELFCISKLYASLKYCECDVSIFYRWSEASEGSEGICRVAILRDQDRSRNKTIKIFSNIK